MWPMIHDHQVHRDQDEQAHNGGGPQPQRDVHLCENLRLARMAPSRRSLPPETLADGAGVPQDNRADDTAAKEYSPPRTPAIMKHAAGAGQLR
ncbi:hypothetical protein Atai01_60920 [Amycolatopsis taiwanensis]|uniref:Uncharacterized protein n=1 Tax=Amycolatopsis taiwanensis TaxID=342230 RepID=A0A9W6VFD5_9PSEU|nr:hypothetical protein Atai01_60920 [Amycolatopsis taiwanensis]